MSKIPGKPENTGGRFFNLRDLQKYDGHSVKLRILLPAEDFVTGYIKFTAAKKPIRIRDDQTFPLDVEWGPGLNNTVQKARRFWATAVLNRATGEIQVFEWTQATVYNALDALLEDEDWGDLRHYDVKITAKGSGKDVEYSVVPGNKKPLSPEDAAKWQELSESWVGLDALYQAADPFAPFSEAVGKVAKSVKRTVPDDDVTFPYSDPSDPGPGDEDVPVW